jgi:hypothetical protein
MSCSVSIVVFHLVATSNTIALVTFTSHNELFVDLVLLLKLDLLLSVLKDICMFVFLNRLEILVIIELKYLNFIHLLFMLFCVVCKLGFCGVFCGLISQSYYLGIR